MLIQHVNSKETHSCAVSPNESGHHCPGHIVWLPKYGDPRYMQDHACHSLHSVVIGPPAISRVTKFSLGKGNVPKPDRAHDGESLLNRTRFPFWQQSVVDSKHSRNSSDRLPFRGVSSKETRGFTGALIERTLSRPKFDIGHFLPRTVSRSNEMTTVSQKPWE